MAKIPQRSTALLLILLLVICGGTQGRSFGRGGGRGSGGRGGGSHGFGGGHSFGSSHGFGGSTHSVSSGGSHSFGGGGHPLGNSHTFGAITAAHVPVVHSPSLIHQQTPSRNSPPPIGWNVPAHKPETPSVAVNKPPVHSQTPSLSGASYPRQTPVTNPVIGHNTAHRTFGNTSSNAVHTPIQPHVVAPVQQSYPQGTYYPPGGVHPQTGPVYYPNPQPGTNVATAPVMPQQPIVIQQQKKDSKLGLGTGLAAGALAGAVVGHLLTPTNNHPPQHNIPSQDRDRVIIINNTPSQAAPAQQTFPNNPQPGFTGQPGQSGFTGQPGQPDFTGQLGQSGQPGQPGQSGFTGQPGQPGQPGFTGQPGIAGQPAFTGQSDYTVPPGTLTPQSGQPGYVPPVANGTNCYMMNYTETDPNNPSNVKIFQRPYCPPDPQQNQIPQYPQQNPVPQYPQQNPIPQYPQPGMQPAMPVQTQPGMVSHQMHHGQIHHHKHNPNSSEAVKGSPILLGVIFALMATVTAFIN